MFYLPFKLLMDSPIVTRVSSLLYRTLNVCVTIAYKGACEGLNIISEKVNILSENIIIVPEVAYEGVNIVLNGIMNYGISCYTWAKNIWFVSNICSIISLEYVCYLFGRRRIECLKNVCDKIYSVNKFSIKLFQVLSSTINIFTEEEISYLKMYTDNTPYTTNDIDQTFLKTLEEIGNINPDYMISLENDIKSPSNSGMVSLIYKGRMKNGNNVVVKVLRNNINEILREDYVSIFFLIELINIFLKSECLVEIFSDIKDNILSQTGFKHEQLNLKRIKNNFKNIDQIVIPEVYDIFNEVNENIIVMEYLDGKTIFEIDDKDKDDYVTIIFEMITKSIFYDGVFHGDLHPGNIIFLKQDNGDKKIGLIDFGIVETLTREEQYGFFKISTIVYLGYDECIKKIDEFLTTFIGPKDILESMNSIDYSNLKHLIIKDVINTIFFNTQIGFNINNLYMINAAINKYGLSMNKNISKTIIAFFIIDRFCNKLSPNKTYKSKIDEVYELFDCLFIDEEFPSYEE